ncbi:beta-galactosidase trimerization domain-containing protein, partial [Escherichia coli]|uniref:beta-galactosidase trimerization domain-containing protein n=1 Tax=Escherichia coli TaxID=562 RepID=UPI0039E146D1
GGILGRLGEVAGSRVLADAAVIFSWEAWWATDTECRPSQAVGYLTQVHAAYAALHAEGLTVDIVRPGGDLSAYRVVVVP